MTRLMPVGRVCSDVRPRPSRRRRPARRGRPPRPGPRALAGRAGYRPPHSPVRTQLVEGAATRSQRTARDPRPLPRGRRRAGAGDLRPRDPHQGASVRREPAAHLPARARCRGQAARGHRRLRRVTGACSATSSARLRRRSWSRSTRACCRTMQRRRPPATAACASDCGSANELVGRASRRRGRAGPARAVPPGDGARRRRPRQDPPRPGARRASRHPWGRVRRARERANRRRCHPRAGVDPRHPRGVPRAATRRRDTSTRPARAHHRPARRTATLLIVDNCEQVIDGRSPLGRRPARSAARACGCWRPVAARC